MESAAIHSILAKIDTNHDGQISRDEFIESFEEWSAEVREIDFSDLEAPGGGCRIEDTAERAMSLVQLEKVMEHMARRLVTEVWLSWEGLKLEPKDVTLYGEHTLPLHFFCSLDACPA